MCFSNLAIAEWLAIRVDAGTDLLPGKSVLNGTWWFFFLGNWNIIYFKQRPWIWEFHAHRKKQEAFVLTHNFWGLNSHRESGRLVVVCSGSSSSSSSSRVGLLIIMPTTKLEVEWSWFGVRQYLFDFLSIYVLVRPGQGSANYGNSYYSLSLSVLLLTLLL